MRSAILPRRIATISLTAASLFIGALAVLHLRMIVSPAPQEMREGAAVWLTRLLLEGRNPYALQELPAATNVYGIFYHLVVWPFAAVFGNGFAVHRMVSAISIAAASALMYRLLRRSAADRGLALVGTMLFYASSLYFVGPLARPDGLGLFLSMASLTLLFNDPLTRPRLLWGLVFALLALITKIYFAYPPFVLAAYLLVFRSSRRGLALGVSTIAASAGVLLLMSQVFPSYISLSLVTNSRANYDGTKHLLTQTRDWLIYSLPLTVALVLLLTRVAARRGDRSNWSAPSIFTFASVANAVVFAGWLGWHPGAHMTYLFQLVTPVLIPAVLPAIGKTAWPRAIVTASLPVALLLSAHYFPMSLGRFAEAEARFAHVDRVVKPYRRVLGSTEVAGPLALSGRPVADSGQSEYFGVSVSDQSFPGLVPGRLLQARWDSFMATLADDIRSERYDLIIRSRRWGLIPEDMVAASYRRTGTVELDFAWSGQRWPVDLWEPAPAAGAGSPAAP